MKAITNKIKALVCGDGNMVAENAGNWTCAVCHRGAERNFNNVLHSEMDTQEMKWHKG